MTSKRLFQRKPFDLKIMSKSDSFKIKARFALSILFLMALAFSQTAASHAQSRGEPVTLSGISTKTTATGTVVSIAADGLLNRAQTWQDHDGYHVVVPSAGTQNVIQTSEGIKIRQVGHLLEIVVQTRPGASVNMRSIGNRMNLNVDGKLQPRKASFENQDAQAGRTQRTKDGLVDAAQSDGFKPATLNSSQIPVATDASFIQGAGGPPASGSGVTPDVSSQTESDPGESSVMSGGMIMVVLSIFCVGLLVLRRRYSSKATAVSENNDGFEEIGDIDEISEESPAQSRFGKSSGSSQAAPNGDGPKSNVTAMQRKTPVRSQVAIPVSLYGAYQVDMEIGKLVQGQPHRLDVVGSRAPDDRRAIEASLLKVLNASIEDEEIYRRARAALEEYGFVARQSAALLSASDPYERTSAARMLGDFKSPSSLPFLLEALYDNESLVRNQAVLSIGELKLPSAIGALLDIARKHPDVPGTLLSRALSACSVEGLDFFDSGIPAPGQLNAVNARLLADEITNLQPAASFEELPETADDEKFVSALEQVQSEALSERTGAIKTLGLFPVKSSIAALARVARMDPESSLKALAVSSLAFINHESVFPSILIAMADESREVRAAAARSLSRLSFDRADAYIRVTETDDNESLCDVADACIKAGIATQSINRMSTGDHQAYESMAVVSLLVKAKRFEPLLDAMTNHTDLDVRLVAIHILGLSGDSSVIEPMRDLVEESHNDVVGDALLEAITLIESPPPDHNDPSEPMMEAVYVSELSEMAENEASTASLVEAESGFDFTRPAKTDTEMESESDPELRELDSSGLPEHPIA